jgi:nucleoredoxin
MSLSDIIGTEYVNKGGDKKTFDDVKEAKVVLLYFSTATCPPCQEFTPLLIDFYNEVNEFEKNVEVVFVSFDDDEQDFKEYLDEMPWLAINFAGSEDLRKSIKAHYKVPGFPWLLVVNKETGVSMVDKAKKKLQDEGPSILDEWLNL